MDYEKNVCPILNVDGVIATGKQFDLEITLPEDNRSVIYGVVRDCYKDPVENAVVKLIEVVCDYGKEERRPVSHTFTDEDGQFVFGPLCANRFYEIEIWVDFVKHCKVCKKVERDTKCLKGIKLDCKEHEHECKPCHKSCDKDYDKKCEKECEKKWEKHCEKECEKHCDKECDKHCEKECEKECDKHCEKECEKHCEKECDKHCEKECEKHCEKECDKHCEKECERPCDKRPYGRPYGRIY